MPDINFLRSLSNINNNLYSNPVKEKDVKTNNNFKDIINEKLKSEEVTFSKHANERIEERNIDIGEDVTQKLNEAAEQAKNKGLNNVLVMIDNAAFILSTKNNKIITVVNKAELKENIFTNIDGAVIK
jgi:flagellar operon protein